MGECHIAAAERPEHHFTAERHDVELHLFRDALFLQLAAHEAGGEGRGIEWHTKFGGQIGDRADVILVAMRQHDAEQVFAAFFDEGEIGQHQFDTRQAGIGKCHAEIAHDPFAATAIEIDVHANLAGAAEWQEYKFVARSHG